MTSLTDRYVSATVRGLDDAQRGDVERELRATIEDMVDARVDDGAATRDDAERAVLVELGDPMRLAAGYTGSPLHLIGPAVYPQWRRLVTLLLWTVVPTVAVINLVIRLFVDDVAVSGVGPAFGNAALTGLTVALHVLFWTTLVFALVERTQPDALVAWDPDQLPEDQRTRSVGVGETVASVVVLLLMALALVWQHTSSPVRRGDEAVPALDPALWSGWIPLLLAIVVAQAVLAVAAFRARRWTVPLAVTGLVLDVVAAGSVLWLLHTESLFNGAFVQVLVAGGWADAVRDLTVGVALGVVVVTVWDQVETFRRVRASR
ncbi:permease prefix domain 1-containing protein [Oryzobacter telluris]|uniref:permease prefix domain 1-containing protein n=1 Tax=Oryzobacter telluris TaxID=3149179 RepID=UPI00370D510B